LNFNPLNLSFNGTATEVGEYQISVKATDNQFAFTNDVFTLFVNPATVAIENIGSKIVVYPNPSSGKFVISLPSNSQSNVVITDVLGRTIKQFDNVNTNELHIDLSSYANGVYNIQVKIGEQTFNDKIVIND